jgi:transposase
MLFVGDDWAEDHHDVEIVDDTGRVLARRRLPEGPGGITRLHALIGEHLPEGWADGEPARAAARVKVGIETDRGPWVAALVATGYEVFAINPMSVARYRERHSTSGAKSDSADAHVLAEIVRLDRAHHRPLAGDSDQGEAIKLTARTHQSLVWDRTRHGFGCGRRCGTSFPSHSRPSPTSTPPTHSSCSGGPQIPTKRRG